MGARVRGWARDRLALPAPLDSRDVAECMDRRHSICRGVCSRNLGDCHVPQGRNARGNDRTDDGNRYPRAMFLGQTGLAIGFDTPWILAMLIPFYLVLRYGVVAREEAYLARKFGGVYLDYKSRVRRWL